MYIPTRLKWPRAAGGCRWKGPFYGSTTILYRRSHNDTRSRLSAFWTPTGGGLDSASKDSHALLIRAGFLRQAHSGIFHLLPLGCRVQEKVERLIDKHMRTLGASKLLLSTISSDALWRKSGRLETGTTELFHLQDRKKVDYLLSPTHEEEITSLVASICQSYKELPLRLYQISRKYRDELRPRQGLLRTREFVMKDLYTFDHNVELAMKSYNAVREVYRRFFDELKIPYLVAEADSGNMGGHLSHEYHFPTPKGEDHVISCSDCGYVANEELAERKLTPWPNANLKVSLWHGVTDDGLTLVNVHYPSINIRHDGTAGATGSHDQLNLHAVKKLLPSLKAGDQDHLNAWREGPRSKSAILSSETHGENPRKIINIYDHRIPPAFLSSTFTPDPGLRLSGQSSWEHSTPIPTTSITGHPTTGTPLDLLKIQDGDGCPRCPGGTLKVERAVELGHTFLLGTRYSEPLSAAVAVPQEPSSAMTAPTRAENHNQLAADAAGSGAMRRAYVQMGCHGIGVSRLIGAVAEVLADGQGLNWPRALAPYEAVVIAREGFEDAAAGIYDALSAGPSRSPNDIQAGVPARGGPVDAVLDDRAKPLAWKLRDADLVGYPVVVVLGRAWAAQRQCEVQCRRLEPAHSLVAAEDLPAFVGNLLSKL